MKPQSPKEWQFWSMVLWFLNQGKIPTPTMLNIAMGWKKGGGTNQLSGNYASIRREIFENKGLIKVNDRWRFPR